MFANINESTAASNEIIAAVMGKSIRILGLQLIAAGDVTATIEDSDGTNLIGPMAIAANGGICMPPVSRHSAPYADVPVGKAVHLLLGGAVQVGGAIQYHAK